MKRLVFAIALIAMYKVSFGQEETKAATALQAENDKLKALEADSVKHWKIGGIISVNSQQVSLTNWAAGGNNSISVGSLLSVYARYKKGKSTWDNNLELAYGVIKQGNNRKWWKNDDRIQFTTKYGREAFKKWYYSALGDFRTQFAPGYNYPNDSIYISKFMAPGYAIAALGMDYKPNDKFSLFISPLTGKFTFVNDDSLARNGAFGVQAEKRDADGKIIQNYQKHREEFGAYLKMMYSTKVMENVKFATTLELFTNYMETHFGNVDVNWTTLTTFRVNKYISATLATQLIYDNDISVLRNYGNYGSAKNGTFGPDIQFKEVLALGFSYNFGRK
ncbi:MAG: DUF3078 domain-containing protein [Bacteroidetes bacterium]|nr:DUF3078 domain-containing protein [Bacteroidota bacterium]